MCVRWEASNEHKCGNGNKALNVHIIPRRPWRVDPGSHCDDARVDRWEGRKAGWREALVGAFLLAGGLLLGEGYLMPVDRLWLLHHGSLAECLAHNRCSVTVY